MDIFPMYKESTVIITTLRDIMGTGSLPFSWMMISTTIRNLINIRVSMVKVITLMELISIKETTNQVTAMAAQVPKAWCPIINQASFNHLLNSTNHNSCKNLKDNTKTIKPIILQISTTSTWCPKSFPQTNPLKFLLPNSTKASSTSIKNLQTSRLYKTSSGNLTLMLYQTAKTTKKKTEIFRQKASLTTKVSTTFLM